MAARGQPGRDSAVGLHRLRRREGRVGLACPLRCDQAGAEVGRERGGVAPRGVAVPGPARQPLQQAILVPLQRDVARGQGRSHCVRLARAGADIVAIDACGSVAEHNGYPPAQPEDLAETVSLVESEGRKMFADEVDVRDAADSSG